jgi:hypothetical protein
MNLRTGRLGNTHETWRVVQVNGKYPVSSVISPITASGKLWVNGVEVSIFAAPLPTMVASLLSLGLSLPMGHAILWPIISVIDAYAYDISWLREAWQGSRHAP